MRIIKIFLLLLPATILAGTNIVGGRLASPKEYPHVVEITFGDIGSSCSGTIVSDNTVITAAHCVLGEFPNGYSLLNKHTISVHYTSPKGEAVSVSGAIARSFNSQYLNDDCEEKRENSKYDIAAIIFKEGRFSEFKSFPKIRTNLKLVMPADEFFSQKFTVVGFGYTSRLNPTKERPVKTTQKHIGVIRLSSKNSQKYQGILSSIKTNFATNPISKLREFLTLVKTPQTAMVESGDSGGPLFQNHNELIGVTTEKIYNADVKETGIETYRISHFSPIFLPPNVQFLEKIINKYGSTIILE